MLVYQEHFSSSTDVVTATLPFLITFQAAFCNSPSTQLKDQMCQVLHKHMDVRDFCLKEPREMVIHTVGTGRKLRCRGFPEFVHHQRHSCEDTVNIPAHPTAKGTGSHQLSTLQGLQQIRAFTLFHT